MPRKFAGMHENGDIFKLFLRPTDRTNLSNRHGRVYYLNSKGFLVPFLVKIRLMIDDDGQVFIVMLSKKLNIETNMAFMDDTQISDMTEPFYNIIKTNFYFELDHRNLSVYDLN
jgi:hypothetical protein